MNMLEIIQTYSNVGAAGLSCILVAWTLIYLFKYMVPKIDNLEKQIITTNEILRNVSEIMRENQETIKDNQEVMLGSQKAIENNTEAMKNFSQTLHEFSTLMAVQNEKLKDIEDITTRSSNQLIKLSERVAILKH